MTVRMVRTMTPEMMRGWGELTSDYNPLHVDPEFAAETRFGRPIVFATVTLALLAEALRTELGPAWSEGGYLDVRFRAPVFVGEELEVTVAAGEGECRVLVESAGEQPLVVTATPAPAAGDQGAGEDEGDGEDVGS